MIDDEREPEPAEDAPATGAATPALTSDPTPAAAPVTITEPRVRKRGAGRRVPGTGTSSITAPAAAVAKRRATRAASKAEKNPQTVPAPKPAAARKKTKAAVQRTEGKTAPAPQEDVKTVAPQSADNAAATRARAEHEGLVRVGPTGAAVWADEALARAMTDKDRKRLNKVLKRVLKRANKQ